MLRGINKQDIFFDKQDYLKFTKIIINSKKFFSYNLYSYVIMPNHVHLEIKDNKNNLSKIMQYIQISYASYFNKKYNRTGHLFQDRYRSKPVESNEYVIKLMRYIHQNPVAAAICKIEEYEWSSYNKYLNNADIDDIVDTEDILSIIEEYYGTEENYKDEQKTIKQFIEFNKKNINIKTSKEFLEYEIRNKLSDKELIEFIYKELNIDNIQDIQKYNTNLRNNIIRKIKKIAGCSNKQIARVLGINQRVVEKA